MLHSLHRENFNFLPQHQVKHCQSLDHRNTCSCSSQTRFVPTAPPQVTAAAVSSSRAAARLVCAHPARLCACVSVRVAGEVDMSLDDGSLEASSISLVKSLG